MHKQNNVKDLEMVKKRDYQTLDNSLDTSGGIGGDFTALTKDMSAGA